MSTSNSSHTSDPLNTISMEEPSRRSPDVDKFVDHFLSLMCDRSRRQILEILSVPNSTPGLPLERRSSDIAKELGLSPATTSGHLRQLAEAGLLDFRREGNTVFYRLCNDYLVQAFHNLVQALGKEHNERYHQQVS